MINNVYYSDVLAGTIAMDNNTASYTTGTLHAFCSLFVSVRNRFGHWRSSPGTGGTYPPKFGVCGHRYRRPLKLVIVVYGFIF